ncbi:hypothetical protein F5876DRAFT_80754 [Lentinula aff. lateritia]|uniref:Uncharacterized protein n=1 Tax=Lentinula aff. lateritia TaxID=2804960 RepID=A0ACC1TNU2_9AGAR|nr:hypothetical protein F5876DRAFT_80754 [Lentinula aff. lateritia]
MKLILPLSHLLLSLLLLASPTLITLGRASPLPTPPISSTSPISSPVNPSTTAPTHTPTSSSLSSLALNTTLPHPSFDPEEASTPLSPRSLNVTPPTPRSLNLRSTMGKLTDEKIYVLLGFSYTGQLAGTQHDKSLFPLDQLQLPGLTPTPTQTQTQTQPGQREGDNEHENENENENEDLVLLQKPSIQDPKGLYWKCFIVASLGPWSAALPQLKSQLRFSTAQTRVSSTAQTPPNSVSSLPVLRIPRSIWASRAGELGISSMCVNPRGKALATLMVHKDLFAGNKMLSKGAEWRWLK